VRVATLILAAGLVATPALAQDADRSVADGGLKVEGWKARVDRRAASQGKTVNDSKFTAEGQGFRLSVGPAGNFWNPAHVASGDFDVKATFTEHKMDAGHPHSYGVFIGGADLESDTEKLLYCIAYGDGTYMIRMFHKGAQVTTVSPRAPHAAVKKAAEGGGATNTVGWSVRGGNASCVINGTSVKTVARADIVGPDKLASTDGVYGIRVSHNLELSVTGYGMTKP